MNGAELAKVGRPLNAADLAKAFARKWREKYGESPAFPYGEAAAFFKRQLAAGTSAARLTAVTDFFFDSFSDPWVTRCRHSFSSFRATYNVCLVDFLEEEKKRALTERLLGDG